MRFSSNRSAMITYITSNLISSFPKTEFSRQIEARWLHYKYYLISSIPKTEFSRQINVRYNSGQGINIRLKKVHVNHNLKTIMDIFIQNTKMTKTVFCPVLIQLVEQVPKCFGLVQIFFARPITDLHIVPVPNLSCQTKRWFPFSKFAFLCLHKIIRAALAKLF